MADIRVVVQVNALERMIIVDGKTQYIEEDYWNANIQNVQNETNQSLQDQISKVQQSLSELENQTEDNLKNTEENIRKDIQ